MGWGFRTSVSFGGRGFRLTSSPRGVYVTAGARGFYYRQRLGGRAERPGRPTAPPDASASASYPTTRYVSADIDRLTDIGQDEFIRSLNEWTRRGWWQVGFLLAAAAVLVGMYSLDASAAVIWEATFYSAIALAFVRHVEQRRRRFFLVYDLDDEASRRFQQLEQVMAPLASAWIRSVDESLHHGNWKYHAGATTSIKSGPATVSRSAAPLIVSNVAPISIVAGGVLLLFFPDRLLVRKNGRYAALSYGSLEVGTHRSSFVWDAFFLPRGAEVVGHTWRFVNKDGGPDRRFNNNRQIRLIRMGYLGLASQTGLRVLIQSTAVDLLETACQCLGTMGDTWASAPSIDQLPENLREALTCLGLTSIPDRAALKSVYREYARRNHPDKFASCAPEIRLLAEERMKQINAAYGRLWPEARPTPLADEANAPVLDASPPVMATIPWWRHPTTGRAVAAALACWLVFTAFRAAPASAEVRAPESTASALPAPPRRTFDSVVLQDCALRSGPSSDAEALGSVRKQEKVAALERSGRWVKVATSTGVEGWTGPVCWRRRRSAGESCKADAECESAHCEIAEGEENGACAAAP